MDANSGAVLYERSPDAARPPASVTKILTALVILEHGQLDGHGDGEFGRGPDGRTPARPARRPADLAGGSPGGDSHPLGQ